MHNLFVVESRGQRVLTSAQIADCYDTTVDCIRQNFHANRSRFVEGKHYIALTGAELRTFKNEMRISHIDKKQEENEVRIPHSAESKAKQSINLIPSSNMLNPYTSGQKKERCSMQNL